MWPRPPPLAPLKSIFMTPPSKKFYDPPSSSKELAHLCYGQMHTPNSIFPTCFTFQIDLVFKVLHIAFFNKKEIFPTELCLLKKVNQHL